MLLLNDAQPRIFSNLERYSGLLTHVQEALANFRIRVSRTAEGEGAELLAAILRKCERLVAHALKTYASIGMRAPFERHILFAWFTIDMQREQQYAWLNVNPPEIFTSPKRAFAPHLPVEPQPVTVLNAEQLDETFQRLYRALQTFVFKPHTTLPEVDELMVQLFSAPQPQIVAGGAKCLAPLQEICASFDLCIPGLPQIVDKASQEPVLDFLQLRRRVVSDALACYEAIHQVSQQKLAVEPWLATHLPGWESFEWIRVVQTAGKSFARCVELFTTTRSLPPSPSPEHLFAATVAAICTFPAIHPLINPNAVQSKLVGSLCILDEPEFHQKYFASSPKAKGDYERIADIDFVNGFSYEYKTYLRSTGTTVPMCVHESLHVLSSPIFFGEMGRFLTEAVTEHLNQLICGHHKIPFVPHTYKENVTLLKSVLTTCEIPFDTLLKAYFHGNVDPIAEAIRAVSGDLGFKILRTADNDRLFVEVYNAWMSAEKHHREGNQGIWLRRNAIDKVQKMGDKVLDVLAGPGSSEDSDD